MLVDKDIMVMGRYIKIIGIWCITAEVLLLTIVSNAV